MQSEKIISLKEDNAKEYEVEQIMKERTKHIKDKNI